MADFKERTRGLIKEGEGFIRHMYLDSEGNVTIGVGNLLSDVEAAQALPFVVEDSGESATSEEISNEFETISNEEPNRAGHYYSQFCKLELDESNINQLLDKRINEFESGLRRDFEGYDEYPESARLGLIDMAFNLGNYGLTSKFPTFTKAAREQDWETCANECRRLQVQDSRNEEVKELFLACLDIEE